MESEQDRKIKELGSRIDFLRSIAFMFLLLSTILTVLVLVLTHVLSSDLKIWIISVCGCFVLALTVALFLARKDATTSLFVTYVTAFFAGLLMGISVFSFGYQIKRS